MRRGVLLILCAFLWLGAMAQKDRGEGTPFNGLISDQSGASVKNIKVEVKASGRFTYTDKIGRFGLTNVEADDVLILSRKDMSVEVAVGGRRSIKILLQGNLISQAEESKDLIDMGFGFVKRRDTTNATGSISGEELRRMGVRDLERALMSRVPGLAIIDGQLSMRGVNSINSSTKMLLLVDNQEVPSLSYVNIGDIESVTILRDGVMYGFRGANGVILVKTISAKK